MKKFVFICLLTIVGLNSFAQLDDSIVIAKSEIVNLSYTPTNPISKSTITFLKYKNNIGIQLSFLTPYKYISQIYIERVDSFVVGLSTGKSLILNRPLRDTLYMQKDGSHIWQIIYLIDSKELEELRQNKIVELLCALWSKPI